MDNRPDKCTYRVYKRVKVNHPRAVRIFIDAEFPFGNRRERDSMTLAIVPGPGGDNQTIETRQYSFNLGRFKLNFT